MPGRFSNLEFNRPPRHEVQQLQTRTETTAPDYLAAAEEEDHWSRFEPALRLYTRALQADRTLIRAWVGQVQMLVQLGESHEAQVWSDKALELFRNNGDLLAAKAQACARQSDRNAAVEASDASMQAPGSSPWRWIARGEVLLARRQRFVEDCFRKALAEPTAQWFDRVIIARVCLYHRRFAAALQFVQEAMRLDPSQGCLWLQLGHCQRHLGLATAAVSYQRCLEIRPDLEEVRRALESLDHPGWGNWLRRIFRGGPRS